jgi:trigger factor
VNIKIEDINDTRKKLLVSVGADEVEQEHDELVKEFAKIARVPGFRAGKAPLPMVARRFGKEITEELNKKIFSKAYREALEESKFSPLQLVEAPTTEIQRGADNELEFVLDIHPEFSLPEYKGLPIKRAPEEVTEEEMEKAIQDLLQQRADFKVVEREARKGDYVKTSYEGKVGDQSIEELVPDQPIFGKQGSTWEEVDSEASPIPGLAAAFAGMKTGDKKDVPVSFPADFTVEALRGKDATYAVEVLEVRERELPELNEEFVKTLGVESVDQLKEHIREDLSRQKKAQSRSNDRQQVSEALTQAVEFPLPESAVERETEILLRQFMVENMRRGVPQEEFETRKEELHQGARQGALHRVKAQLILAKIAEAEKIAVDEKDISRYVYFEAQRRRQKPEQLVRELRKNPEEVDAIRQGLLFDKTLDFLVENASVTQTDQQPA